MKENKKLFYSALFLSGKPMEVSLLKKITSISDESLFEQYMKEFNLIKHGLQITLEDDRYTMGAAKELLPSLSPYFGEKEKTLGINAEEVLAIIAYKQPITRQEIEEIRGIPDCRKSINALLERGLIAASGRKESSPGKPQLFVTTKEFLKLYNISSLSELPTYKEWNELNKGA